MKTDILGNTLGIDYGALREVMQIFQVDPPRWKEIFDKVVKCFYRALEISNEAKPSSEKKND